MKHIINEELSNDQLRNLSDFMAEVAKKIKFANDNNGKIYPKENTNKYFKKAIELTNQSIIDLSRAFKEMRKQDLKRRIFKNLGNTGEKILANLESNKDVEKVLYSAWGTNTAENFIRLHSFVNFIKNTNAERIKSGNKNYQDFSKKIAELDKNYKKFMQDRLSSIMTEDYFGY